ncbi:MAG: hypothetical protein CFE32_17755 [Alphaproteobacteria bacterium PA3]|nr:MAG: hypothetical protein CFE32_17755 [Alphaproteobacteria bacterium PA3]
MGELRQSLGVLVLLLIPMGVMTGLLMWFGVPDALAGVGGTFGWIFVFAALSEQEKKQTRLGRAVSRVSRLFSSERR